MPSSPPPPLGVEKWMLRLKAPPRWCPARDAETLPAFVWRSDEHICVFSQVADQNRIERCERVGSGLLAFSNDAAVIGMFRSSVPRRKLRCTGIQPIDIKRAQQHLVPVIVRPARVFSASLRVRDAFHFLPDGRQNIRVFFAVKEQTKGGDSLHSEKRVRSGS